MTLAKDAGTGAALYSLKQTDGYGREVWSELGNGIDEVRTFDAANGRLYYLTAGTTYGASSIQDLEFEWYDDGNLYRRHNHNITATETLVYDEVDRLTQAQVTGEDAVDVSYSDAGRILTKDGVGSYAYEGTGSAGPFAVTSANGMSYGYDDNGRMTSRGSDTQTWYSYDLPHVLKNGSTTATFSYGVNRARYKQVLSSGVTIRYVNGLFEEEDDGSTITYRHYVHIGDRVVAMMERVGTTNTVQYLHRDHQNSVVEVTDSSGSLVQSLAYDAWGLRRDPTDWSPLPNPFTGSEPTERGYTGHEHLDPIGLIHMNGRVQDPVLGRFLSADPFVQAPYDSQSLNRYSYVGNNPLTLVDPSGFQEAMPEIFVSACASLEQYCRDSNDQPGTAPYVWLQHYDAALEGHGGVAAGGTGGVTSEGTEYDHEVVAVGQSHERGSRFNWLTLLGISAADAQGVQRPVNGLGPRSQQFLESYGKGVLSEALSHLQSATFLRDRRSLVGVGINSITSDTISYTRVTRELAATGLVRTPGGTEATPLRDSGGLAIVAYRPEGSSSNFSSVMSLVTNASSNNSGMPVFIYFQERGTWHAVERNPLTGGVAYWYELQ